MRSYYSAAEIGLRFGWGRIYNDNLERIYALALDPDHHPLPSLAIFGSPPPVAWITAPFTRFPFPLVYLLLAIVSCSALIACWWLVAPGAGMRKAAFLLAGLALFPVAHGLQIGNVAVAGAACIGISWALIDRGRPWLGGLFLVPYVLDPNMASLIPLAYLLLGHWRPVVVLILLGGAVAAAAAISLGPTGLNEYLGMLRSNVNLEFNRHLTLLSISNSWAMVGVQASIAAAALVIAYRSRRLDAAFVAASIGSLLFAQYLHMQDLTLALIAGWVFLRTEAPLLHKLWLVVVAVAAELVWVVGPVPMLAALAGWLLLVAMLPRAAPVPDRV